MRNIALYVKDILQYMREAEEFIGGLQHDEFAADKKTFNAVARAIEVIGEAAKNIPERVPLHGTSRILRQAQDPTLRILEGSKGNPKFMSGLVRNMVVKRQQ